MKRVELKWYFVLFVGVFIFALGTILSIMSKAGASPLGAMFESLHRLLDFPKDIISYGFTVFVIFVGWCFSRTTKLALMSWVLSWIYSFFIGVISKFVADNGIYINNEILKYVVLVSSVLCTAFGIALIIYAPLMKTFGSYAADSMHSRIPKIDKGTFVQIYDLTFIVIAVITMFLNIGMWDASLVGIGTLFILLVQGPLINFFLTRFKHIPLLKK